MSDLCFVFYTEVMLVVIFVVSNVLCSCASPLCLELVSLKANIFLHFLLWLFLEHLTGLMQVFTKRVFAFV